jgi:hypothetical protein
MRKVTITLKIEHDEHTHVWCFDEDQVSNPRTIFALAEAILTAVEPSPLTKLVMPNHLTPEDIYLTYGN